MIGAEFSESLLHLTRNSGKLRLKPSSIGFS
jgi:hypothetical protein